MISGKAIVIKEDFWGNRSVISELLSGDIFAENLAKKNLNFTRKIEHIKKKTIREKLLSYLSGESMKNNSLTFEIPFNRQQLADYLSVDRSALSTEIGKLQKDGIVKCKKNKFTLLQ